MNLQENIRKVLREESEMLDFIFDPKTNKVIGFNLTYNSEEFNNIRYDENGRSRGYGFGPQKDDFGNPIKFDSLKDVQKWYSDKTEKHLQKQTQNQKYSDLSYIANSIRKIDGLDYQVINRGSCFKFAKEISKLGYNKFTFIFSEEEQEVIHVYVKLTNNLYFDANGFHTKKEIKNEYYVDEDTEMYDSDIDELDNFSDLDTYECLTTIPIPDNVWKKVIQVIKKSKMNLQESIKKILREENYSPAGKEITPNKIVIHKSNPKVRNKILNEGLKARAGECYKIYAGYGEKCIPAIFATNSTNKRASFDSTYDDDVWEIDTEMIPDVKWYKDRHYESRSKHIVTFENIPANAITLKHEGTGKDWGLMESNDNKFNKEKITKTFQDIVDKTLNEIKNICGDEDDDTFPDWLSDDDCDVANSIDKINISDVKKINNISSTPMFKVDVNIDFNSIFGWIDYDDLMYSIAKRIIGKWKIRFIFNIEEQENSNKREMWESGKHKNINESKFFRRRIDLDEVKELLSVNVQQVFYETKSYGQFKYELTLRVVEDIMWDKYKMGWEDLPEQEEIEFVTEVSNMFNDIIIDLYKRIRGNM